MSSVAQFCGTELCGETVPDRCCILQATAIAESERNTFTVYPYPRVDQT